MNRFLPLALSAAAMLLPVCAEAHVPVPSAPLSIGSRLELFVDRTLIDTCDGVDLKLHEPQSAGTVLRFDQPWEGGNSDYVAVFKDGDIYRMYYRGSSETSYIIRSALRPDEKIVPDHIQVACYAESKDGIEWVRPSLGIIAFNGSKENNIVWDGPAGENFGPFRDDNPAAPAAERYKAVGSEKFGGKPALMGFVSADGVHWAKLRDQPIITDGAFDSLNVVFWDASRQQYTAVYRDFTHGVRTIKYAHSPDFLTWTSGQWGDFGHAPPEHLYTNGTVPYFRAPHIYLALPRRFLPWRTHFQEKAATLPGVSDAVFMSSRDCLHWNRFEDSFIRPGLDERNWATRNSTPARGIVPTGPNEISIYIGRNYTFPSDHLERFTLRTDGFVSAHAGHRGGEFVTKPFTYTGSQLVLNYSTSANGSVRVEVLDADCQPLAGFRMEDSPVIFGDRIAEAVDWRNGEGETDRKPLARLAGMPIRLRFALRDADIYSLQFK